MFTTPFMLNTKSKAQAEIDRLYLGLDAHKVGSPEFGVILDRLLKLDKAEEEKSSSRRVSPDTKATIAANLLGIAMIIKHEELNVIATRALGFVQKVR